MTSERHAQIKELFLASCALPAERRAEFLDEACRGDTDLRARVEELLQHHTEMEQKAPARRVVVVEGDAAANDPRVMEPTRPAPPTDPKDVPVDSAPRNYPSGFIVAGRYRIVDLIGRGGMGEVYRADDLTLKQTVALKFLPTALGKDPAWLARLLYEVRVARRVTHAHVCRVHDIEEADGEWFIVMEYLDGENLHLLLERIGRVPEEKALDIARQLCAGVAAAHARRVLHRDLKPANVMLDARGRAVITDFGLAIASNEITRSDIRAGTPAYMAPEQLTGKAVTVRSDIYALGLVLYEMFTGHAAFQARTAKEYVQLKLSSAPQRPSQIVREISPEVERVILRCLEPDPRDRPASALAVLAALPGGDPMSAALAAGVTPAPEWVAAAGRTHGPRRAVGLAAFAGFLVLLLIAVLLSPTGHPVVRSRLQRPPMIMAEKAREIVAETLKSSPAMHEAYVFSHRLECPWAVISEGVGEDGALRFACAPGSKAIFWYEQSPEPVISPDSFQLVFGHGGAVPSDRPMTTPGTTRAFLDPTGRLLGLEATRRPALSTSRPAAAVDWGPLFARAGLRSEGLQETTPALTPRVPADERRAWVGAHPDPASSPIRVEGASLDGIPVSFAVVTEALEDANRGGLRGYLWRQTFVANAWAILQILLVLVSLPLALRNLRLGRSDVRGGLRLAGFIVAVRLIVWLLQAPHPRSWSAEFTLVRLAVTGALAEGLLVALFYAALEPIVRRFWPHTLIAWSRALAGRIRDPLVGWHVLMGAVLGAFWNVLWRLDGLVTSWLGLTPRDPLRPDEFFLALNSTRQAAGFCVEALRQSIYTGLLLLLLMALLRAALRRPWMANVVGFLLITPLFVPRGNHPWVSLVMLGVGGVAIGLYVLRRFGLVPLITGMFINQLLQRFPLTLDAGAWYADLSVFALLVAAGLGTAAFLTSRRPASGPLLRQPA